ncbi:MAG: glycoside hydrolase family 97 protein [Acidobacteriia bacterium]|nr:glycoside hydrolase family 97 protein [Terriglobia bacterium]
MSKCIFPTMMMVAALTGTGPATRAATPLQVTSPDGNMTIEFLLKSNPQPYLPGERPYYRVSYKGHMILTDSPLGLDFIGSRPLDEDFEILGTDIKTHDDMWENAFGARRQVRDHYNQLTVSLRERQAPGRRMELVFRAYDAGAAFRYVLPKQEALEKFTLSSENTGFYFPQEAFAYALSLKSYTTPYETDYHRVSLAEIKPTSIVGLPLLIEVPKGPWAGLLEADLTDYAGMYVGGVRGVSHALMSKLSPLPDRSDEAVVGATPKATPWRVILLGSEPGALIENADLILSLNPPCALADTSWIKPGKAAWDWWSGSFARNVNFQPGMNTATMLHYVDFAARSHFAYMLVDAGWYPAQDYTHPVDILHYTAETDVPRIIEYATSKGVKVLLWVFWGALDKHLDEALALYKQWGAAGVKVDFMNRDDQEMVNFYERVVRKAAENHMVVDFHGAYKPTGLRRTYPNLLTREGVMGAEYNKWSKRITPEHDVTLPFTRMLAGPMDYTPGGFRNATREQFKPQFVEPMTQGTRAHELAKYVVFESPLEMVSDYPEAYEGQPGFEFIEKVPTVWDDTKVLNGEPAKYVTIAREKDNVWYLGAMTNWDARDLEIPFGFLGSGEYEAQIFADGPDADQVAISLSITKKRVKAGDKLHIHLASGGGLAVIFTPVV